MAPLYWNKENRKGLVMAISSTLVVFLIMTGYGIYTYQQGFIMLGWGRYMMIALIALFVGLLLQIGLALAGIYSSTMSHVLSVVGIVLFSIYIAYDTQLIFLGKRRSMGAKLNNPVVFALNLYLDIINLFQFIQSSR